MAVVAKRKVVSLFSEQDDVYSHQVRIVLVEEGVNVDIHYVKPGEKEENLLVVNPYDTVPTLIDRDLVLYEARIIIEYLDERFPHPPLLPVYPVARAETRKMMFRMEQDWYILMRAIQTGHDVDSARAILKESLVGLNPVFLNKMFFLSDEFSLLDCVLAPLLWRLPQLGVEIELEHTGVHEYMQRVFKRDAFQSSLTDAERQVRVA